MPYFTRQPYAATARAPRTAGAPPGADFVTLAREVLAAEAPPPAGGPFRPRRPLLPGTQGSLVLDLALEDDGAPVPLRLAPGALAGAGGAIPAAALAVAPAALTLAPGAPATVTVTVAVPPGTAPGRYAGLIEAAGGEPFAIPLEVEVR